MNIGLISDNNKIVEYETLISKEINLLCGRKMVKIHRFHLIV